MAETAVEQDVLVISDHAAEKVRELLAQQENPDVKLRVFVSGGGCSGFQYGMTLEEEAMEGDQEFEVNNINVIVDPRSMMYLEGAEIDYVDNMMGGGFKIENPNAASTCGCGTSFTPKDEDAAEEAAASGGGGCGSCGNSSGF